MQNMQGTQNVELVKEKEKKEKTPPLIQFERSGREVQSFSQPPSTVIPIILIIIVTFNHTHSLPPFNHHTSSPH
jgi:hypothetical protein